MIVPRIRGKESPVVQRVSMGGSEEVSLIREGLSSAIKTLKKEGFHKLQIWMVDRSGM